MKKRKMRRRSQKNKEDSIPSSILGMIFYTSVYNFTDNSAPFQNKKFSVEIRNRGEAVSFLDNANTYWRYLVGSYHRDSLTKVTETYYELKWEEKYGVGGKGYSQTRKFVSAQDADNHYSNLSVYKKKQKSVTSGTQTVYKQTFYPSDGVVLAKSQVAFQEVKKSNTDVLEKNNHYKCGSKDSH